MVSSRFDPARYVKDFESAWNLKDADLFLQHHADDVEFEVPFFAGPQRGKQAAQRTFRAWFGAFGEMEIGLLRSVVQEREVALLYRCTARHTGELEIAPGEVVPSTGRSASLEVAEFSTLGPDGRFVRTVSIFDTGRLLQQLGVLPSPGASPPAVWGARAPHR